VYAIFIGWLILYNVLMFYLYKKYTFTPTSVSVQNLFGRFIEKDRSWVEIKAMGACPQGYGDGMLFFSFFEQTSADKLKKRWYTIEDSDYVYALLKYYCGQVTHPASKVPSWSLPKPLISVEKVEETLQEIKAHRNRHCGIELLCGATSCLVAIGSVFTLQQFYSVTVISDNLRVLMDVFIPLLASVIQYALVFYLLLDRQIKADEKAIRDCQNTLIYEMLRTQGYPL
jgi:hypothetical protein